MGRSLSGNTNKQQYSQSFPTNVWGGKVSTFTVPAGVSKIKLTAVAVGGCLAGVASIPDFPGDSDAVIFARMNGTDPAFISAAKNSTTYFSHYVMGKYISGSIVNSAATGINGNGDVTNSSRMNGCYFNALDAIPWGVVITQKAASTAQMLSSTTDGFNFTHVAITTSSGPVINSCVFGGNGQAMVAIGSGSNGDDVFYTNNYGTTWTELVGMGGPGASRIRYLNGTWIALNSGSTSFYYTTTPLTGTTVNAWSSSGAMPSSLQPNDIGWTGSTYVVACSNATNVCISSSLGSGWATQAHGGNLSFDVCESGNGEVLLFKHNTAHTSAASMRATSGAATTWFSVSPYTSSSSKYDACKYLPFTSGGMWYISNASTASSYTRASLISGSATLVTNNTAGDGNSLTNATVIRNVQYLGGNYCHLGSSNGLGKYSSSGVMSVSLRTSAQLTTEFGYIDTTYRAPSITIAKNGTTVLTLQGGGTSTATVSGSGTGYPGVTAGSGNGPTGIGGISSTTAGATVTGSGNAGSGNKAFTTGGAAGGTWQYQSAAYAPMPNSLVPGTSGGWSGNGVTSGGGASLFGSAGNAANAVPTFSDPATVFNASSRIGAYGAGANGAQVLTTTGYPSAGGAQGCYKYEIECVPGDVFTLTLPGVCYVSANGATGTNGGPGGESFAMIEWEA